MVKSHEDGNSSVGNDASNFALENFTLAMC